MDPIGRKAPPDSLQQSDALVGSRHLSDVKASVHALPEGRHVGRLRWPVTLGEALDVVLMLGLAGVCYWYSYTNVIERSINLNREVAS